MTLFGLDLAGKLMQARMHVKVSSRAAWCVRDRHTSCLPTFAISDLLGRVLPRASASHVDHTSPSAVPAAAPVADLAKVGAWFAVVTTAG